MVRMVLVPLDGSDCAEQALGPALSLARLTGASLLLLRAAADDALPAGPDYPLSRTAAESAAYLKQVQQRLASLGLTVHAEVTTHDPRTAIPAIAALREVDVIAMCAHGHSGVGPTLGSVTRHVLGSTRLPVLLASGRSAGAAPSAFRSLLIPVDGSAFAEQALGYVIRETLSWSPEVRLLRVVEPAMPPLIPGFPGYTAPTVFEHAAMETQYAHMEARRYVEMVARTRLRGFACYASAIVGCPAKVILDESARGSADVIVMATHERPDFDRLPHGSVVSYVLRHAQAPVLLLRGEMPAAEDTAKVVAEVKSGAAILAAC